MGETGASSSGSEPLREARCELLVRVEAIESARTPQDPARTVIQLWSINGERIAEADPCD